jgi:hypothetical protein
LIRVCKNSKKTLLVARMVGSSKRQIEWRDTKLASQIQARRRNNMEQRDS